MGFRRGEPNRPKKEIFRPFHHFLRILFLVALFRVRAFLLHLSKRLCHVFDLIPNIKAYVDSSLGAALQIATDDQASAEAALLEAKANMRHE